MQRCYCWLNGSKLQVIKWEKSVSVLGDMHNTAIWSSYYQGLFFKFFSWKNTCNLLEKNASFTIQLWTIYQLFSCIAFQKIEFRTEIEMWRSVGLFFHQLWWQIELMSQAHNKKTILQQRKNWRSQSFCLVFSPKDKLNEFSKSLQSANSIVFCCCAAHHYLRLSPTLRKDVKRFLVSTTMIRSGHIILQIPRKISNGGHI